MKICLLFINKKIFADSLLCSTSEERYYDTA